MYKTLGVRPPIDTSDTYSGCASTLPSVETKKSLPNFDEFTVPDVNIVSNGFKPERVLSLWYVRTFVCASADWIAQRKAVAVNRIVINLFGIIYNPQVVLKGYQESEPLYPRVVTGRRPPSYFEDQRVGMQRPQACLGA